jgi:uncharacterized protein
MNCPKCNVALSMSDRQGVEIDFCPQCRGVWLDRGELDKIIERASLSAAPPPAAVAPARPGTPPPLPPPQGDYRRRYDDDDDDDDYRRRGHDGNYDPHRKKKKGFLGDLFDF